MSASKELDLKQARKSFRSRPRLRNAHCNVGTIPCTAVISGTPAGVAFCLGGSDDDDPSPLSAATAWSLYTPTDETTPEAEGVGATAYDADVPDPWPGVAGTANDMSR